MDATITDVMSGLAQPVLEAVEVIVPFREHKRGTAAVHRLHDVVADPTSAQFVVDQVFVENLELHAFVGIRAPARLELRRLHEDQVLERSACCLRLRVHSMLNRPALHEDDGMVA